jgi:tetratricopeptide (TPR) repeat protein
MKNWVLFFGIFLVFSVSGYASYEIANSKYLKGDINGALYEVTKDITSGVRDSRLYYLAIKILKNDLKDYPRAIDYTVEAIKLFPQESKNFSVELAELYFLSGKYDKSLAILLNMNSEYPGDARILYLIGVNYYYTGRYYKAVASFEASRYLGNKSLELYEFLGKSYSKVGRYREALELLSYVYNSTGRKDILAQIVEIANILDVSYSDYIVKKSQVPTVPSSGAQQQLRKTSGTQVSQPAQQQLPSVSEESKAEGGQPSESTSQESN